MIRLFSIFSIAILLQSSCVGDIDIETVPPDLITPLANSKAPAPGRRVRQFNEDYKGSKVYHLLYLPTDWEKGKKFPVIVEYAGNKWKTSPGTVEGSNLYLSQERPRNTQGNLSN